MKNKVSEKNGILLSTAPDAYLLKNRTSFPIAPACYQNAVGEMLRQTGSLTRLLRTALSQGWGTAYTLPVTVAAGTLIRFQMRSVFNKGVYSFEFFGLTGISEEINF